MNIHGARTIQNKSNPGESSQHSSRVSWHGPGWFFFFCLCFWPPNGIASQWLEACVACHGSDGLSRDAHTPVIAGTSWEFIEDQLLSFRARDRPCLEEYFIQKGYPDGSDHCQVLDHFSMLQIENMAHHYADQPFIPPCQDFAAEYVEWGERLHQQHCGGCHGQDGSDPASQGGILAGQRQEYLQRSMEWFRSGDRLQTERKRMAMRSLEDSEIHALTQFYLSRVAAEPCH